MKLNTKEPSHVGIQWQKWAIYKRLGLQYTFDYAVEDFITQNLMKDADARARRLFAKNQTIEATLWSSFERGMRADQAEQVQNFMTGFYKAFNCKNPNLLRPLWLPNRDCELVVPGYIKAVRIFLPSHFTFFFNHPFINL